MAVDLDEWSRDELEDEARRRGISGYEKMTRSELLRTLLSGRRSSGLLGALFGKVVERVREVLPGGSRPPPENGEATRPSSRAPAKKGPPPNEPILTRTMAGVLAAQGHDARALAIYEHLLERTPDDPRLLAETNEVRARMAGTSAQVSDEVAMVALPGARLLVSWDVGADSVARAGAIAGASGPLVVRVVIVASDGSASVTSSVREQKGVEPRGEWVIDGLPPEARMTASIGVEANGRFVSAAHTRVVRF